MVGRDEALEKVRQQLLEGRSTSIGQTALFQGIGGLGKTQLAVEYAYHYRNEYPNGVYWITADENIDAQLTRIAVAARWVAVESEHAIKLDVARHRLKTYSDYLIVFDNLESVDAIRDYPRAFELGKQALEMQREFLGDKHPDVATSINNLANRCAELGDHPRALELGKQALEMQRDLLRESHPDTIDSLLFVLKRLYANPLTAGRGKALADEFLRHIPRDHPSRAEVLNFLSSRKGFRAPEKIGHNKKRKKK